MTFNQIKKNRNIKKIFLNLEKNKLFCYLNIRFTNPIDHAMDYENVRYLLNKYITIPYTLYYGLPKFVGADVIQEFDFTLKNIEIIHKMYNTYLNFI